MVLFRAYIENIKESAKKNLLKPIGEFQLNFYSIVKNNWKPTFKKEYHVQ